MVLKKVRVKVDITPVGYLMCENYKKNVFVINTAVSYKAFVEKYVKDEPKNIKKIESRVMSCLISQRKVKKSKDVTDELFEGTSYHKSESLVATNVRDNDVLIKQQNKNTQVEDDEIEL